MATQVSFGDLHVVEVPVNLHVLRVNLSADSQRIGAAVQAVSWVVHSAIHGFEYQNDPVPFCDGSGALQGLGYLSKHLLLAHPFLVVAGDYGHLFTLQAVGHATRLLDFLEKALLVLGMVHAWLKTPGRKLRNLNVELLSDSDDAFEIPLLISPKLHRRESEGCCSIDPFEKGQLGPPHLQIDGEARMGRVTQLRVIFLLSKGGRSAYTQRGGGAEEIASVDHSVDQAVRKRVLGRGNLYLTANGITRTRNVVGPGASVSTRLVSLHFQPNGTIAELLGQGESDVGVARLGSQLATTCCDDHILTSVDLICARSGIASGWEWGFPK